MTQLRAGILGMGVMGRNHLRVLSNLEGVELVGIADNINKNTEIPGTIKFVNSIEELIKIGIDYCVISVPTILHEAMALKLIENQIHCLIEKPIAHTLESAKQIAYSAIHHEVIVGVGHVERYNSALQQARNRILDGELGTIYQIATRRQSPYPARISDVGVVSDLATHDIDLTSWLTKKKYTSVSANAAFRTGNKFEDLITINGVLEDNVVVNHLVNWLSPMKERKIIITGEKGTFVVDTLSSDLTYYENGRIDVTQSKIAHFKGMTQGDIHSFAFEKPEPLFVEHCNFRDKILGLDSEIVSLDDGIRTVQVAEAIIESYQKLETIKI